MWGTLLCTFSFTVLFTYEHQGGVIYHFLRFSKMDTFRVGNSLFPSCRSRRSFLTRATRAIRSRRSLQKEQKERFALFVIKLAIRTKNQRASHCCRLGIFWKVQFPKNCYYTLQISSFYLKEQSPKENLKTFKTNLVLGPQNGQNCFWCQKKDNCFEFLFIFSFKQIKEYSGRIKYNALFQNVL